MFTAIAIIGFCFAFVVAVPVLGLRIGESIIGVVVSAGVRFLATLVIGWLIFLAVKAGTRVEGPMEFMLWTHAAASTVGLIAATQKVFNTKEAVFDAVGGAWLSFVALHYLFV